MLATLRLLELENAIQMSTLNVENNTKNLLIIFLFCV